MAGRGGRRDGAGRKAGVPNKATGEAKKLAQQWGPKAIKRAAQLAGLLPGEKGKAESEAAQMVAINTILDRAYGKATQPFEGELHVFREFLGQPTTPEEWEAQYAPHGASPAVN